jgi:hypothetical protein
MRRDAICTNAQALVSTHAPAVAQDWPSRDEGVEIVRGFRTAAILQAVVAPAELRAFGRINAPKANAGTVDFECVAVDDAP